MASSMGREVGTSRTPRWGPEAIGSETLDRAVAIRQALHDSRVKRTVRQRTTHLTMWERAINPTVPVPMLDRPFQIGRELRAAGATLSEALSYPRALCAFVLRLYAHALRSGRTMLREAQAARAAYEATLTDALADGEFTASERRACAARALYVVTTHEELAAALAAEAEAQERDPRPAA